MEMFIACSLFLLALSRESSAENRYRNPVNDQLADWAREHKGNVTIIRTSYGTHVDDVENTLTAGHRGPIVMHDSVFMDIVGSFDRERIPSRTVYASGTGAFGKFTVTHDITRYTKAKLFDKVGKTTNVAVRFSRQMNDRGTAETTRDNFGMSVKFYTQDGIYDLLSCSSEVYFVRDAMKYPLLVHAFMRNPVTNIKDPNMMWDFITLLPETTFQTLVYFSDRGTPQSYRHTNFHSVSTYKMVNDYGKAVYVKFHWMTHQGVKNLTAYEALQLAIQDPDYYTRDLYNAIGNGYYPSWTLCIQIMTFEEAKKFQFNPFDVTKVWPREQFKYTEVGKLTLFDNPTNQFAQVEQLAFSPAHLIPGLEPSPEKILQGRLFAYGDAQRYRLGVNYLQLPVNCPTNRPVTNYQRNGLGTFESQGEAPNYYPNSFHGPQSLPSPVFSVYSASGDVNRYNSSYEDNYSQGRYFWNYLSEKDKYSLVNNMVESLKDTYHWIQDRAIQMFSNVHEKLGRRLQEQLGKYEKYATKCSTC